MEGKYNSFIDSLAPRQSEELEMKRLATILMVLFASALILTCELSAAEFTFDSLPVGTSANTIENHMTQIAGYNVSLVWESSEPFINDIGPLGDHYGHYVYSEGENRVSFEFQSEVPLQSCEFHWAVLNGTLEVYADDYLFLSTEPLDDQWNAANNPEYFTIEAENQASSFSSLRVVGIFGEGTSGAIGIDNLIINPVPEPSSITLLLCMLAMPIYLKRRK
jgi:hypothetical protein